MMEAKMFEVRDRMTFIPVLAVRLAGSTAREDHLLRRAGFGSTTFIQLTTFNGRGAEYDPHLWNTARTLPQAHLYIQDNWWNLESGDVIDVEFILGETSMKKEPE